MAVSNFGRNIRAIREANSLTQQQFADSIGVTITTVSAWETRDKKPRSQDIINKICNVYNVNEQDLYGFSDGYYAKQVGSSGNFFPPKTEQDSYAPVWAVAACGDPSEVYEQSGEEYWVPPTVLKRWNNDGGVIIARGDSMDMAFPDGAPLYVVPNEKYPVQNGDIAWVKVNGDEATVKRYKLLDGIVILEPESTNPEHKRRIIDASDPDAPEVRVLGKVVRVLDHDI